MSRPNFRINFALTILAALIFPNGKTKSLFSLLSRRSAFSLALIAVELCGFSLIGFGQVCAPQPSTWWPGDGNATDLVAGNNGALFGGVTFAPGKVGQAFSFNGSGYVSFGTTPSIIGTGPLTIELWLKTGGDGFIITQRDSGGFNGEYLLSVGGPPNGFGFAQQPGHLCWSEFGDNRFGFNFCSVSTLSDNVFHHIAVTREVDGTGKIYIDGTLDSSQASPPLTLVPLNVYLGEDVRDFQAPITGLIDEVTLYKTALSAESIRAIFLAGSAGKCKVGCVGPALVPTTVTPIQVGNGGSATLTVTGCGLSGMTLLRTGQSVVATNIQPDSLGSSIKGSFDLRGRSTGTWDLLVSKLDGSTSTLVNAVTVVQGGAPDMRIQKIASPAVPGQRQTYFITVSNSGTVDSRAITIKEAIQPWFTLISTNPTATRVRQAPDIFPRSVIGQNYDAFLEWDLPSLGAGESKTFIYTVLLDPTYPIGRAVRGPACIIEASEACHIPEIACYSAIAATCILQPELCPALIEAVEACELAYGGCLLVAGAICTAVESTTRGSTDPNDIIGPPGAGVQRWIPLQDSLQYSILFENLPTATKPATTVGVTGRFDPNTFDLSTLTVGPISFGSSVYNPPQIPLATVPLNADVDLRPSLNLIVRLNAALNMSTGVLMLNFISIDPATGLPPADVLAGFLEPGAGGNVTLKVSPRLSLTTGAMIINQASIVFDTNTPILTSQWLNTIDKTKPTSHVLPLNNTQNSLSFQVMWSGTDVGSGIKDYTIFVSENDGPFTVWLSNTTATEGTFTGQNGKRYAFYSIASDQVGNQENAKATAEATTQVQASGTCLQDDSSGNTLQFNSTTGDYQFTKCGLGGFTLSGKGTVRIKGSVLALQDNANDRRVLAKIDNSVHKATASIQVFSQRTTFTIMDRNTTDTICICP
jgi:hypothetical protein